VVPTTYSATTAADLEAMGVKMVIYANHGIRASIRAMEETYAEILRTGSTASVEDRIAPMQLIFELQGMPQFTEDERTFLRSAEARPRAVIPAAGDHMDEYSMKHIAADIPMTMLDINGKPLLQRQMEVLSRSGVRDVTVVGGYQADRIQAEGVRLVLNDEWRSTGIAHSFLHAHGDLDQPTLMIFSDILFDQTVLERLLRSDRDITLLVDRTYRTRAHHQDKRLDTVEIANPRPVNARTLDVHATQTVRRVGKGVDPVDAHGEFIGLAYFSERGYRVFREVYQALADGNGAAAPASLTDVLQAVIDQGDQVSCVEVSQGWMEIHSFDDYRDACALVSSR
jgi:phosphoenolpyruvate phosphomutase